MKKGRRYGCPAISKATAANVEQTLLYWRLGKRILTENLTEGRAEYGKRILATLSQELVTEFGDGFSYSALTRMARFAELFTDEDRSDDRALRLAQGRSRI